MPLLNMDFDGLRTAIIEMLSGAVVTVEITSFQNDTVHFQNKDDVCTYLIHFLIRNKCDLFCLIIS